MSWGPSGGRVGWLRWVGTSTSGKGHPHLPFSLEPRNARVWFCWRSAGYKRMLGVQDRHILQNPKLMWQEVKGQSQNPSLWPSLFQEGDRDGQRDHGLGWWRAGAAAKAVRNGKNEHRAHGKSCGAGGRGVRRWQIGPPSCDPVLLSKDPQSTWISTVSRAAHTSP